MKTLLELDKIYRNSILSTSENLKKSYATIETDYKFDLKKTEISEAILERLKSYYTTQDTIKKLLDKHHAAPAADYFVETVLFFLRLYLRTKNTSFQVHSEKSIKKKRGSIRPDISIWNQDEVISIIECKTQLGWNRDDWELLFIEREQKLKMEFPHATSFLIAMTASNWGGFGKNKHLGNKYFCLLNNIWPINYSENSQIMTPIEALFKQLV